MIGVKGRLNFVARQPSLQPHQARRVFHKSRLASGRVGEAGHAALPRPDGLPRAPGRSGLCPSTSCAIAPTAEVARIP